jgi:Rieske Fe-S protein
VKRREFLERLEGWAAAAAAAGGASVPLGGCLAFHYVNGTVAGNRLWVRIADFGDDRFVLVDAPNFQLPILVYRQTDGAYSAVSTRCMHRGCQVDPAPDRLICPCHGSEYTHTGEVLKGPTQLPLRAFPVTAEGGRLAIQIPPGDDRW